MFTPDQQKCRIVQADDPTSRFRVGVCWLGTWCLPLQELTQSSSRVVLVDLPVQPGLFSNFYGLAAQVAEVEGFRCGVL